MNKEIGMKMGGEGRRRERYNKIKKGVCAKAWNWNFMTKAAAKQPSTRTKTCMTKHVRKEK